MICLHFYLAGIPRMSPDPSLGTGNSLCGNCSSRQKNEPKHDVPTFQSRGFPISTVGVRNQISSSTVKCSLSFNISCSNCSSKEENLAQM